jgi:hypothetical protein
MISDREGFNPTPLPALRAWHFYFRDFAQASLAHPENKNAPDGAMVLY